MGKAEKEGGAEPSTVMRKGGKRNLGNGEGDLGSLARKSPRKKKERGGGKILTRKKKKKRKRLNTFSKKTNTEERNSKVKREG